MMTGTYDEGTPQEMDEHRTGTPASDNARVSPAPPPMPAQPFSVTSSTKRDVLLSLLLISVVTLVLFVIGGIVWFFLSARTTFNPVVDEIVKMYNDEDHESLYAITDVSFRSVCSEEQLENMLGTLHQCLGNCHSHTITSFNRAATTAGRTARLICSAEFERGLGTIDIALHKSGGRWLLLGFNFNSPALVSTSKCPNCSYLNTPGARFCGGCGKPIEKEAKGDGVISSVPSN